VSPLVLTTEMVVATGNAVRPMALAAKRVHSSADLSTILTSSAGPVAGGAQAIGTAMEGHQSTTMNTRKDTVATAAAGVITASAALTKMRTRVMASLGAGVLTHLLASLAMTQTLNADQVSVFLAQPSTDPLRTVGGETGEKEKFVLDSDTASLRRLEI